MNLVEMDVWILIVLTLAGLSSRKLLSVLCHKTLQSKYICIMYCVTLIYEGTRLMLLKFFKRKISRQMSILRALLLTSQWVIISILFVSDKFKYCSIFARKFLVFFQVVIVSCCIHALLHST